MAIGGHQAVNIRSIVLICGALAISLSGCGARKGGDQQTVIEMVNSRNLGLAYLEENKLIEAESEFRKLIEIAPDEALGYANLALVYLRKSQYAEAEAQIKKALKLRPKDPDILLNLAVIYEQTQRHGDVLKVLVEILEYSPDHVKTLYKLAQIYSKYGDEEARLLAEGYLSKIVESLPANIAARLQLVEILLKSGKGDPAAKHMEELRKQIPELPEESVEFFEKGLALAQASEAKRALVSAMIFHNFLKETPLYQSGTLNLKSQWGPFIGSPNFTFNQDVSFQMQVRKAVLDAIHFTDVTSAVGLDSVKNKLREFDLGQESGAILTVADYDSDGDQDLYLGSWIPVRNESEGFLFRNDFGKFVELSDPAGLKHPGRDAAAIFADYDNNGYLDLFVVNTVANLLYHNSDGRSFSNVAASAGVEDSASGLACRFADFDHDGDLDLYMANAAVNRLYRNNSDGSFTESSEKMAIGGGNTRSRDTAVGDFDEDGDLDLFVVNESASNILYTNLRQGRFQNVTAESGLVSDGASGAATAGDYNNDGFLDLFVTALGNGRYYLYRNRGDGTFEEDTRSEEMHRTLQNTLGQDARFFDFDNDGFLDLLVAGKQLDETKESRGVLLFHNNGTGEFGDVSSLLPSDVISGCNISVADYDEDGDMDIFITGFDGSVRLLRNDGGNVNRYLKVQLVGLRAGSGKNNHYGIGAKLEVRAGDLYESRVVTEPITHFGLGQRFKPDEVRVLWPNGVAQNLFHTSSDQKFVEEQTLKGSCAFLYAWDGQRYSFVTDVLWRSALGMPLGIMAGTTKYAFPDSTREYLKIPGEMIKSRNGIYTIQITEELWETAYYDQVKLVAIDHPDTVDIFVDERFVPPPVPPLRIFKAATRYRPRSAIDERGNDLLPLIRERDDVYISSLAPAKYQGVTRPHDLILDLGDLSRSDKITLFMNGWIFPTDASINVAIAQSDSLQVVPPYLQLLDNNGQWRTVVENMSFPMGKNKYVVIDLTDKFLTDDYRIRIRSNMQIYWDYIFYSIEEPDVYIQETILRPISANIHYRGFSRLYRKGGRHGPHWFDYGDISTEPKWRDLTGYYTRYGDVLPLLLESDDRYVIINAGDEVTIEFDAALLPELKPSWSRDFLIYSNGWLKDGDLNTAQGKTVSPLPFHGMSRYPYGSDEFYPQDEEHQEYLEEYNTRKVTNKRFRERLLSAP